jgi:mevalonate pyrophosphate decarboxylase
MELTMSEKSRKNVKSWLLESNNDTHNAFVLIRSPYKSYVEKKVGMLSKDKGFDKWTRYVLDDKTEMDLMRQSFEFNTLYIKPIEAVN